VNPDPDLSRRRVTSVLGAADADDEVEALLDFAAECRLSPVQAVEVVERVVAAVKTTVTNHPGPSLMFAGFVGFLVGRALRSHDVD